MSTPYYKKMNKIDFRKKLGLKIKVKRLESELSQDDLATRANFSLAFLSDVECGKKGVSLYYFIKIAKVLDINLNDFFKEFVDLE